MPLCSARSHFTSIIYHPNTGLPASTIDPSLVPITQPPFVSKTIITAKPTYASSLAHVTTSSSCPSTATTLLQAKPTTSLNQSGSLGHTPYPTARTLPHPGGTLSPCPKLTHSSGQPFSLTPVRNPPLSPAAYFPLATTFSWVISKYPTTSYYGNLKNLSITTITNYFNVSTLNT